MICVYIYSKWLHVKLEHNRSIKNCFNNVRNSHKWHEKKMAMLGF